MKTIIIGAGAAGLLSALAIKKKDPFADILILEKEDKAGRKLYATGNGHCNLLNKNLAKESFNHQETMGKYLNEFPYSSLRSFYESLGLPLLEQGDYVYPLTYSAASFVSFLLKRLDEFGVEIKLKTKVLDYKIGEKIEVVTTEDSFICDRLIITVGGCSTPKLGSDGSLFPILKKHGYSIIDPLPGLAPVLVKEKNAVRLLSGVRHEAIVSLLENGRLLASQEGELLFKDDGLSGICLFNLESVIARRHGGGAYSFSIDLFPHRETLGPELIENKRLDPEDFLTDFLIPPLAKEVERQARDKGCSLLESMHSLTYVFDGFYPFANSQVSVGGVDLSFLDECLESKLEKGVGFAGEIVDIDGFCGGFNLSWCLISALLKASL